MPVMSGIEFVSLARDIQLRDLLVIYVTGAADALRNRTG